MPIGCLYVSVNIVFKLVHIFFTLVIVQIKAGNTHLSTFALYCFPFLSPKIREIKLRGKY